ncbi:MGMT family protein [Natronoglycomyces albus]|uniref:MGMT family protein n=1 Tax=Natronoglycomyces albus TaxID=2811108 RepID=A0A895XS44_9ACTN|nr:MGMT family protein [Natronoglycomyces albus]QSB06025.1 MGMT family protein [Natronoglycomyces albus]
MQEHEWSEQVEEVLNRLPEGTWTSYGELAELVGTGPRQVARFLAQGYGVANAFRVLRSNGTVSDGFRWSNPTYPDVHDALRCAGIRLSTNRVADSAQRLDAEELRELLKPDFEAHS